MKFIVESAVFEKLPTVCFGVVVVKWVDNTKNYPQIAKLLSESIAALERKIGEGKARELVEIAPFREAFETLWINPNKYMGSIEALAARVEKKKDFPHINGVVDLGNAMSLKYLVPMGAHDLGKDAKDVCVRFSKGGEIFVPFGEEAPETLEAGELFYGVGDKVKTRRWIWRQGEIGKIVETSRDIFYPIDGFQSNKAAVMSARDELARHVKDIFGIEAIVGFVDKQNQSMEF